jgi:magnesium chelatase family protein
MQVLPVEEIFPSPARSPLTSRRFFLDEFPEFGTRVLEVMRQPMEDKGVTSRRAKDSLTFSANFQLIAATNPALCGFQLKQFENYQELLRSLR